MKRAGVKIEKGLTVDLLLLIQQVRKAGFSRPVTEYEFAFLKLGRKWRFDLAWLELKVAFEREGIGGKHPQSIGAHQTKEGVARDCEKSNAAMILGWIVIRGTAVMLKSGLAAKQLIEALQTRVKENR